ncbi:very short patch repair endonuclease [Micromonospora chokoriensis]|uniref:very short patch repair endonuclease n=1 Tax=Micromonospora chokoriensis TaxID=356851 RepID=UPI0022B37E3D|nr:very short patch repair endonuclease [Micromonospora chokoriensis]
MPLPPTPPPSSASRTMKANRSTGTKPELALRRALFRAGLRYRVNLKVMTPGRVVRPDVVFTRTRVAVFVDGCFWHGCPLHGRMPSDPSGYWRQKISRNQERDRAVDQALHDAGWRVIRLWEHAATEEAVMLVRVAVAERSDA